MGCAWPDAPLKTAEHPMGTMVAPPTIQGRKPGCWGTVPGHHRSTRGAPRSCALRCRAGKLTCHAHRHLEADAKELQEALARASKAAAP